MTKIATSWLELILVLLLVVGGMGLWVVAERQITRDLQAQEPGEEDFQQEVLIYQAGLSAIQAELTRTQEDLLKQQLEIEQLASSRNAQVLTHPELLNIPAITTDTILIPAEVLETYLQTQTDLETTRSSVNYLTDHLTTATSKVAELAADLSVKQSSSKSVLVTQANLALAQEELSQKQEKLIEQKLRLAEEQAVLNSLLVKYPALDETSTVLTDTLTSSPDIPDTFIDNQLQLATTEHLVNSLTADVTNLADTVAALSLDLTQADQTTAQAIQLSKVELSMAEAESTTLQEKLVEQQLKLAEQEAAVEAMNVAYPQLLTLSGVSTRTVSLPPGVVQTYVSTQLKLAQAQEVSQTLALQLTNLTGRLAESSTLLKGARGSARQELNQAQKNFAWDKDFLTLEWASLYIGIFLAITFVVIALIRLNANEIQQKINLAVIFGGAMAILAILLAYEVAEVLGAALVGTVIVLAALGIMVFFTEQEPTNNLARTK